MSDPNTNAALAKAGAQADAILKPKVSVRIWVILVVAVVANLVGVIFHF